MNKTALKNFAVRARRKLIEDVTHKAYELGISKEKVLASATLDGGSIITEQENGQVIGKRETEHRARLIDGINAKGFEQVMEEVAYTWFNRFIALRFMEINDYLPSGVRVLSSMREGKKEPDIIQQALSVDLDLDHKVIYELQDCGNASRLYKYLLIKQCNQLGKIMPAVFEPITDYTELLLPDNLLGEGAIIRDLVDSIEEYDWKIELSADEVALEEKKGDHGIEIIGWLYQYYISEKKDEVFAGLKKNIKITKENIPAATQLFTPKWIVKYMIENSLGRLWLESHPNPDLQVNWKYYLEEAEQEPEVQKQLDQLKNPNLKPDEIKVLDPAMGSGHILVYAFDVLYDIYLSAGYAEKDIPKLILEKNLYGLEIDDRAGQLASFALYMKARSRNKKLFSNMPALNLCSIQESNGIQKEAVEYLVNPQESDIEIYMHREEAEYLVDVFHDAKEYGSILEVKEIDYGALENRVAQIMNELPGSVTELKYRNVIAEKMPPLVKQGRIMSMKYDVVCTNPPYMGRNSINLVLTEYICKHYSDTSNDIFAVFMDACLKYLGEKAYLSMITQHSWMFLASFKILRKRIIDKYSIQSIVHLGTRAFEDIGGEIVQTAAFVFQNSKRRTSSSFIGLDIFKNAKEKELKYIEVARGLLSQLLYRADQNAFKILPNNKLSYWATKRVLNIFKEFSKVKEFADSCIGMRTGDNERFLRLWFEVDKLKMDTDSNDAEDTLYRGSKWLPYNKGGTYRKWYGNQDFVVNWENNGLEIKVNTRLNYPELGDNLGWKISNEKRYFQKGITWSGVGASKLGVRCFPKGMIFDSGANGLFPHNIDDYNYIAGFLNSAVADLFVKIINPTFNTGSGTISELPFLRSVMYHNDITANVAKCLSMAKTDWDSFETSWNFKAHPLLAHKENSATISQAFHNWSAFTVTQFNQLKQNEEELNRIFIEIYGLQDELTPEVEDKDITINKADRERDIKSFLSYAVGCTFGRYSLDQPGLIYAGGNFSEKFRFNNMWELNTENGWIKSSIAIEEDNIIPIVDDDYFENDTLKKVVDFVKASFGEETLEENLTYIAETLGSKAGETPRQTIRRYFLKDFYKDHVRIYKKRPIYWLFDSGKENGFKALIYMHRYDPLTVARVRTDYLHKLQKNYEAVISQLDAEISSTATDREKAVAKKRKEKLRKQLEECRLYDQAIAHVANQRIEIDLDDGVKVNYTKFQEVEIPQGEGRKPLKADLLAKI